MQNYTLAYATQGNSGHIPGATERLISGIFVLLDGLDHELAVFEGRSS